MRRIMAKIIDIDLSTLTLTKALDLRSIDWYDNTLIDHHESYMCIAIRLKWVSYAFKDRASFSGLYSYLKDKTGKEARYL